MKKFIIMFLVFSMIPVVVRAATLTTGINVEGIGDLTLARSKYDLTIRTKQNNLKVAVTTVDGASYTMTVDGTEVKDENVPIKEGANKVEVVVSKGDSKETWILNLNIDKSDEDTSGNPATGAFISLFGMGSLLLVGLVFYSYSNRKLMKKI